MSGMDRLTINDLEYWEEYGDQDAKLMARELLAHRRASQAASAPVAWRGKHFHPEASAWIYKDGPEKPATAFGSIGQLEPLYTAPAPSDGLREALQPFASLIEVSGWSELPDDTSILGQGPDHDRRQVTAGDFKRALAAFSSVPAPSDRLREALEDARDVMAGLAEHILKADRVNTKGMFADLQRARLSADAALSASPAQEGGDRHD